MWCNMEEVINFWDSEDLLKQRRAAGKDVTGRLSLRNLKRYSYGYIHTFLLMLLKVEKASSRHKQRTDK